MAPINVKAKAATAEEIQGDGVRFDVGRLTDSMGEASADFWPANTALTQLNIGVVGNLGTGKTQLIKALVAKYARNQVGSNPTPSPSSSLTTRATLRARTSCLPWVVACFAHTDFPSTTSSYKSPIQPWPQFARQGVSTTF